MAHATATPPINLNNVANRDGIRGTPRASREEMPSKPLKPTPAPTPLPTQEGAIQAKRHRAVRLKPINQDKARASRLAMRHGWTSLNLRQEWADTDFMRGHLKVAGVKVASSAEPATVQRMKAKLRAIGIHSPEVQEAIGMPLSRFLVVNPRLPLWASLALVLESTGRFTPEGFAGEAE